MVEYLSGNRIQGSSASVSSPPQTSWKFLDRATATSGNTLSTGTFTAKDNLMILCFTQGNNTVHPKLNFNADVGQNYNFRYSGNNSSDASPSVDQTYFRTQGGISGSPRQFSVTYVNNIANQEKLILNHLISAQTTGANNGPTREESVGKWDRVTGSGTGDASSRITKVSMNNGQTGNYAGSTEMIVLGCDNNESDSGSNFWQRLDSSDITTSSNATLDSGTITNKKYLWVEINGVNDGAVDNCKLRFNGQTSTSDYAYTKGANGGADGGANTEDNGFTYAANNSSHSHYCSIFIVNDTNNEKLMIMEHVEDTASGSANAPYRKELVGKWVTSGVISSIQSTITSGSGKFGVGSSIRVWGAN